MKTTLCAGIVMVAATGLFAADILWDGDSRNPQWNAPGNWSGDREPTSGDAVTFNSSKGLEQWGGLFVFGSAETGPLTIDLPAWAVRSKGDFSTLDLYGPVTFTNRFSNNDGKGFTFQNRADGRLRLRLGTHVVMYNNSESPVVFGESMPRGFGLAVVGNSRDFAFGGPGDFKWTGGTVFGGVGNFGTAPGFGGVLTVSGGRIMPSGQFRIHDGRVHFAADSLVDETVELVLSDGSGRDATVDFSGRECALAGLRSEQNGGRIIVDGLTDLSFGSLKLDSGAVEIDGFVDGVTRIIITGGRDAKDGALIPGLRVNGNSAKWKALGDGRFAVALGAPLTVDEAVPEPPASSPATPSTGPLIPVPPPVVLNEEPMADGGAGGATVPAPVNGNSGNGHSPIRVLPATRDAAREVAPKDDGLIRIPAGPLAMGNHFPDGPADQVPVHTVQLSSYRIGAGEVTNAEVAEVFNWANSKGYLIVDDEMVRNAEGLPRDLLNLGARHTQIRWDGSFAVAPGKGEFPCVEVTWFGAAAFANFKSGREGRRPCYDFGSWECDFGADGYRLPTEAEWEKAARGGLIGKRFPWGDTISHVQANYYSLSSLPYDVSPTRGYHPKWDGGENPYTNPAGAFDANGFGLFDVSGNVWEWCNDWYAADYYQRSADRDPTGPEAGESKILRGGAWGFNPPYNAVAFRNYSNPLFSSYYFGFRIARGAD